MERILGWLIFHANCGGNNFYFYRIKKNLLDKYGKFVEYEVQHIEGKECWTCYGNGIHHYTFNYSTGKTDSVPCWSCNGTGQYKKEFWTILEKNKISKYVFHIPYQKIDFPPEILKNSNTIKGYIQHKKTKYTDFALWVLFFLYDKKHFKSLLHQKYFFKYWDYRIKKRRIVNVFLNIFKRKYKFNNIIQEGDGLPF